MIEQQIEAISSDVPPIPESVSKAGCSALASRKRGSDQERPPSPERETHSSERSAISSGLVPLSPV